MKKNICILLLLVSIMFQFCVDKSTNSKEEMEFLPATYDKVDLIATEDTIHLKLEDDVYTTINSINSFRSDTTTCIAFLEKRSQSINIYDLNTSKLIRKIDIRPTFKNNIIRKPSLYMLSLDSIYIASEKGIFLLDSSGVIRDSLPRIQDKLDVHPSINNIMPLILRNGTILVGLKRGSKTRVPEMVKEAKLMYAYKSSKEGGFLDQKYSDTYTKEFYNSKFMPYSYCVNGKGDFVFSYAADSFIRVTDFNRLYKRYNGSAQHPVRQLKSKNTQDYFYRSTTYSAIYFDSVGLRYLRIVQYGLPPEEKYDVVRRKRNGVIIMDKDFRIIGESVLDDNISPASLLITKKGDIYARTADWDDRALHFVKLEYKNNGITADRN